MIVVLVDGVFVAGCGLTQPFCICSEPIKLLFYCFSGIILYRDTVNTGDEVFFCQSRKRIFDILNMWFMSLPDHA